MKSTRGKKFTWRLMLQILFFGLIGLIAVNHTLAESGQGIPWLSDASLHALCPFGGVVSLYQLLSVGTFVQKIHASSLVLTVIIFGLAIIAGPVFCSWVCPLGSIQEWFGKIGKKLFKRKYNHFIPQKFDRYLRYLRYLVLGWVVYLTAAGGQLVFANVDPYFAMFNFWSDEVAIGGVIVLAITLVGSLFVERPWCKYACPYGALLGLTNLFSISKIKRQKSSCISCGACSRECPMNIPVDQGPVVRDPQCIRCMKCTSKPEGICPIINTVDLTIGGQNNAA
jgi:polyferredoxin